MTAVDLEAVFRLGEVVIQPHASSVLAGGEARRVDFKAMQVLLCLARGGGEVVSKGQIFAEVWNGDAVSDDVLTGAVSTLRKALGDDARSPRFIQTIPRVGYRLIAPVLPPNAGGSPPAAAAAAAAAPTHRWQLSVALGALATLMIVGLVGWGLEWWGRRPGSSAELPGAALGSLAVLPLTNLTGDQDHEHLADGMTEALIAGLARTPDLRVISRTSSRRYQSSDLDAPRIARELQVDALVEGSVQQAGGHLRVTVQLIDGAADRHLWADSFDAPISEVLELQQRVVEAIARHLRGAVGSTPPTVSALSPETYSAFLRGRYHAQALEDANAQRLAVRDCERAVQQAPDFALAHVCLAESWLQLVRLGDVVPLEGYEPARRHAERAAELDARSARAETLLGALAYLQDWDFPAAEQRFRQALTIDPNDAVAHGWMARYLTSMQRFDEALAEVQWVRQLDPAAYSRPEMARLLNLMDRQDLALAELDAQLKIEPDALNLLYQRLFVLKDLGRPDEAVEIFLRTLELRGQDADERRLVEASYRASGLPGLFDYFLERTPEPGEQAPGSAALSYAETLIGAGHPERGLTWLERAADRREPGVVDLGIYGAFDELRHHPRFKALLRRIGVSG